MAQREKSLSGPNYLRIPHQGTQVVRAQPVLIGRRPSVTYKSLTRLTQSGLVSRESHFSMRFSLIEHERGFERHGDDHQKNRMAQRFLISEPNFLSSRL